MTYQEVLKNARERMGGFCVACPQCNGVACKNKIPGPGAKGSGDGFLRNCAKFGDIKLNLDTLFEAGNTDTSIELFGKTFKYPIFAAPIGALKLHYGPRYTDAEYSKILVTACKECGIAAFTGDGSKLKVYEQPLEWIKENGGVGVPTIKPWDVDVMQHRIRKAEESGAMAIAMDVDASGLSLLKNIPTPVSPKSVEQLREVIASTHLPVIVKGIMTPAGAVKALHAGAYGIVVSNHGGRVLDQTPATIEVLPEIAKAVKGKMKIFIDGGVRTGLDVFKAIALGADAVLIGRPFVTAVYGGEKEGVRLYTDKLATELRETMEMTGAITLADIDESMVWKV